MINYDLVFDFDSDDLGKSFTDCMILRSFFIDNGVSCEVIFSGNKGFHLEIKGLPKVEGEDFESRVQLFREFAERLKKLYGLKTLDLAVYDYARVWKLPYSVDYRTGLVVLPLSSDEIAFLEKSDNIRKAIFGLCDVGRVLSVVGNRKDFYESEGDSGKVFKLIKEVLEK